LAGIFAIANCSTDKEDLMSYFINSLQMLQHRGKAYWKVIIDNIVSSDIGPFPADRSILKIVQNNSNL